MFGISFGELLIILLIALIVVGPERMPELARKAGTMIRDLRRMYDNLRSDLGPDFEEVERGIHTLRSLDPRRELDAYGRKVLNDLAQEAGPEAQQMLQSSPSQLSQSVKQALTLEPPTLPAPAAGEQEMPQVGASVPTDRSGASAATPDAGRQAGPVVEAYEDTGAWEEASDAPAAPAAPAHGSNPLVARLGHDVLDDDMLDRPLTDVVGEPSQNGRGLS